MKNYCYFNGKITTLEKIKISPYDLGVLRGYGVFDVMRAQNGKPFLFDEHWKRFVNSADELNLKIPINKKKYKILVELLLKKNHFKESIIRTVMTGGISENGFLYSPKKETFYIIIEKFQPLPEEIFKNGAAVMTVEYERHIPHAKITNYVMAIKNQEVRIKNNALEIIYVKDGKALEASTSNFFIVKEGKIITPKEKILLGTTRNLSLKIAQKAGYKVQEREVKTEEIYSADEMFLTATNKDIVPVVKVDGKRIGTGKVGKITEVLMSDFGDFVKNC
ncbi:MAG: hypothetical protein A3J63_03485 [Candidatus Moranbacteria bacterium RIFCSPHIGHO2_02_FULL_40_12b]|nr:MAG: hypothetical protein A3J63_03485 [Candidatus Moranbacteria bacterium RIFCSPHIGHO2_02_FULL_40_12b]OGI23647.1 MAG: hypothetical protein A3E91_01550 [Candidatus Moranbacteria bacterium RIFCSPHIGHO2_12_FULL_40_10]